MLNDSVVDSKYKNNSIKDFTINGKKYKPFDRFKKEAEFKIVYWEVSEKPTKESVYYSTNTLDTVKSGNNGVYAYVSKGKLYDTYYIIDFDNGCVYYFNPNTATNGWIWSRPMTVTIGKHRFCK